MKRPISEAVLLVLLSVTLALAINGVRPDAIRLTATVVPEAGDNEMAVSTMALAEAHRRHGDAGVRFVDARDPEQFAQGHIAEAVNLPVAQFEQHIGPFFEQTPAESILIVYCGAQHCHQSQQVARMLLDAGYTNVNVLVDGWQQWSESGYPQARNSGETSGSDDGGHS